MGYCNRCGEISSSGKCRKCGGRPVASIITSLGTDNSVLVADKWQSQYAESILAQGDNSIRLESPKRNSRQGLNRILSVTLQNACGNCDKKLRYDTPSYLEENVYYCQDCHVQLFSKGLCAACDRPVFPKRDAFIDHGERSWHRNCFRCHGCFALIDHKPMVDLKGRPCCEPCLLAQAGTKPTNTTSTPNLSSPRATYFVPRTPTSHNRPRISPQTFNQQKQPTEEPPPLPPLSPASSIRSSISSGSPVSISSTSSSPLSSARRSPLVSMSSPSPPPSTRVCHACDKQLSGPRVRVPIANGEVWYHYDCLTCHGCGEHFTESRFVSQGKLIYHPKCVPPPPAVMDNKTARYYCCECQRPIIDKCLRNGTDYYHTQCFRCAQCHRVLPYDQPFFEVNNKPHCETCSNNPTSPTPTPSPLARGTNPLCSQSTPLLKSSSIRDNQPYSANVLAHRSRPLPKLGGSKICPRCKTSIAISEDTPGPRASRWHKKCLQCIGCRKQLDSGAKVIEGEHGEWVVRCRSCMDEKWERQKFVR